MWEKLNKSLISSRLSQLNEIVRCADDFSKIKTGLLDKNNFWFNFRESFFSIDKYEKTNDVTEKDYYLASTLDAFFRKKNFDNTKLHDPQFWIWFNLFVIPDAIIHRWYNKEFPDNYFKGRSRSYSFSTWLFYLIASGQKEVFCLLGQDVKQAMVERTGRSQGEFINLELYKCIAKKLFYHKSSDIQTAKLHRKIMILHTAYLEKINPIHYSYVSDENTDLNHYVDFLFEQYFKVYHGN